MNLIYIKLFNADLKPKKEDNNIIKGKDNSLSYNFVLNKLQIDFLFLPFFFFF